MQVVTETSFKNLKLAARGKVRDIYDLGDSLLIVVTDRVSAFDVVLNEGVPFKGHVLTKLSEFWFKKTADIVDNHLITTNVDEMPSVCSDYKDVLEGRSMLVKKAIPFPVECVVRGYITGSGWKDYKKNGGICGISLPQGLKESERFPDTLFTPSTKAELGLHDENISYERMKEIIGEKDAEELKNLTVKIYEAARDYALSKGIIIADTKFEFGKADGKIILIDEALTPDSSRFWRADTYEAGRAQDSMDKQVIRNYLESAGWDKMPPAPVIPPEIIEKASARYLEIMHILMD